MGQDHRVRCAVLVATLALTGCMKEGGEGPGFVSRFKAAEPTSAPENGAKAEKALQTTTEESALIESLLERQSVLGDGSYAQVAEAVMAANARVAEAELRSAKLRSVAASKNWLPSIGPNVSLSSLGDFVASIIIEQVIFDNGRKKAERAFARADVEVAAVNLSDDSNQRVLDALSLYLQAEKGRESSALNSRTLKDMAHFEWVMNERVKGGVSDMSDLNVVRQKLSEIRARQAAAQESTQTALAELNAMAASPLSGVRGLSSVRVGANAAQPLSVMLAEAEKERAIAQATIDRAGNLPGLKASGTVGQNGSSGGLSVSTDKLLGLGTGASLKAIEATKEAAQRKVAQAQEDSNRELRGLEQKLSSTARQASEASAMTSAAKANLDLFQTQYQAGQRQVMDVVGVYETYARQQSTELDLKYETALIRLEIARLQGLLADGDSV